MAVLLDRPRATRRGTPPSQGRMLAAVTALFALVAALACLVPSLRASRIDPMRALRQD